MLIPERHCLTLLGKASTGGGLGSLGPCTPRLGAVDGSQGQIPALDSESSRGTE